MKYLKYLVPVLAIIVLLVTWKFWSNQIGGAIATVLGAIGLGGAGAIRKVKRRAKKKAKDIGPHPNPGFDATARLESRRRRKSKNRI